ncbi:MAG: hypothetical protein J7L82_00230 [Staphylothermus sp.]|nr:hypothetical protein [Staphylothermus sp.]
MVQENSLRLVAEMCRIAFIYSEEYDITKKIIEATIEGSRNDKYKIALGYGPSHGDGWGTVAFSLAQGNKAEKAYNYVTLKPIYEDTQGIENLLKFINDEKRVAISIHSRFISEGIADILNTHPIVINGEGKDFKLWIAHNGTMNKAQLAEELGLKPLQQVSDTYYLGLYIYKKVNDLKANELIKTFSRASKYTKSAMNTINMFYSLEKGLHTVVTSYINDNLKQRKEYVDYYKLYLLKTDKTIAIISSTIADLLREEFPHEQELIVDKACYVDYILNEKPVIKCFNIPYSENN